MLRNAVITLVVLAGGPALAATSGEVFAAGLAYAEGSCGAAFEAHKAHWPDAAAGHPVVWENPKLTADGKETPFPTPVPEAVAKTAAWLVSNYGLIDDLAPLVTYASQEAPPPADWFPRYRERAESLKASVALYDCLRPSGDDLAAFTAAGGKDGITQDILRSDCMARVGEAMAGAFETGEPGGVYDALKPMTGELKACRSGG